MLPKETIVINNPINLNSIMLIFAALCIYTVIIFTICMLLDKKRMKACRRIKNMIEDGHQKQQISNYFKEK